MIAVCCIFKDENDYIEEWVNYHKTIGFDHFIIYDNDSKVCPLENLQSFKNDIKYIKWPGNYVGRQCKAYDNCVQNNKNYDWIAFIDVDEFIVLLDENNLKIKDYLVEYKDYDAVALNWVMFGTNKHKKKQKSVINSYTSACIEIRDNRHVKCIVKPSKINEPIQNPHFFPCTTVNVERKIVKGPFNDPVINRRMRINHYVTRSEEDFMEKINRGGGNTVERKHSLEFMNNLNLGIQDNRIIDSYNKLKGKL